MFTNRRTAPRLALSDFGFVVEGQLFFKKEPFPIRLRDIAAGGASFLFFQTTPLLTKNDFISFSLTLRASPLQFDAEVAWSTPTACGVTFVEDLSKPRLHDLVRHMTLLP